MKEPRPAVDELGFSLEASSRLSLTPLDSSTRYSQWEHPTILQGLHRGAPFLPYRRVARKKNYLWLTSNGIFGFGVFIPPLAFYSPFP